MASVTSDARAEPTRSDFIREIVEADLRTGKHGGRVVTRFPPEPNGYLHIGHAKSICLNFGIGEQYGSVTNLRFDDTNPAKEDVEYVESIQHDVRWLGFSFGERALFASDYFGEMYELAEDLVRAGKAYVDHLTEDEIREYRGSLSEPGRPSPYRDRDVEENLALLRQMRAGDLPDGTCVLRARIDLAASNMKMRDPLLYRIRHAHHDRTGDAWPIYPMYDYAHPISDAIEGITHSLCTLEFENNRPLYDWVIAETGVSERHAFSRPQQIEFARLKLDYTVMSKRKLL
ncbi:MAG: glutaminyl-tRNA synthetase, partial [Actinomycetota bacterium]|nr:glutaminyl-tRNA synthetase [Actinomycetota bacterium]